MVIDDALQGVTDVVRGADLLDSTPWQLALQGALQLPTPRYAHVPLITEPTGAKLAFDSDQKPVVLFPNEWSTNYFTQTNPKTHLSNLPHGSLLAKG